MVSRLQTKASQIGNILASLEKRYDKNIFNNQGNGPIAEECEGGSDKLKKSSSASQILPDRGTDSHKKRFSMRIDPIPPFNPNKQRKSDADISLSTIAVADLVKAAETSPKLASEDQDNVPESTNTGTESSGENVEKNSAEQMSVEEIEPAEEKAEIVEDDPMITDQ